MSELIDYRRAAWAIREDALRVVAGYLASGRAGEPAAQPPAEAISSDRIRSTGGVALIPLRGLITPRATFLSMIFGGGGGALDVFRSRLRVALDSDEVSSILIDVDSPGGLSDLVLETAAEVRAARDQKPVTAVANTMAASAAYWIASQASELVVTPSGDVGSVGVIAMHEDWSAFNQSIGVDPTYVYAGRYKAEFNPDEALSDEARGHLQERVDHCYGQFVGDVAKGRGVTPKAVRETFGEGRMVVADQAVKLGMADRLGTFEDTISRLVGTQKRSGRRTEKLSDHLSAVTADVEVVAERLAEVMATRATKGKGLGAASAAAADELESSLTTLREVVASAGEDDDPSPSTSDTWAEGLDLEDSFLARRRG